jgi:hypothetical protein
MSAEGHHVTHVYLLSSSLPMASSSSVSLGFRSTTDVENVSYGDQALFSSNHPALWLRCHGTGLSFVTPWPSLPLHCTTLFRLFDPWSLYPHIAPHDQPRHVLSGCLGGCIRCPSPPTLAATPTLIVISARKLSLVFATSSYAHTLGLGCPVSAVCSLSFQHFRLVTDRWHHSA